MFKQTKSVVVPSESTTARRLVRAGACAGPLFVVAGFAQMPFREGFDLTKHAFSFLTIGPDGWLQSTVFVIVGVLFAASGLGLRTVIGGRTGVVAAAFGVVLGISLSVAGLNPPQPSFGYPLGTPDGPPAVLTSASILHAVGFAAGVLALIGLLVTIGIALRRVGRRSAWLAFAAAIALPFVPMTSMLSFGTVLLYVVVTAAFVITSVALIEIQRSPQS